VRTLRAECRHRVLDAVNACRQIVEPSYEGLPEATSCALHPIRKHQDVLAPQSGK
jgi:hypothetical protein